MVSSGIAFTGTIVEDTYGEGMHFVMPWNKFTVYELRAQENTDTIVALTIDGMALSINYSILHRPFAGRAWLDPSKCRARLF